MIVGKYRVIWKHGNLGPKEKGYTQCIINEMDDELKTETTYSMGFSYCSKKDNYNKKLGRKISFDNAVSKISDRSVRTALWEALKATTPGTLNLKKHG